jgi:CheY-like chemotaxis protein
MYAECLRGCGFTVTTTDSTDDRLRRASNADVIVAGIRVHGSFDGVGLVGRLRHADETKQTPIIVLTACASESDRQRAQAAGSSVFLTKPCLLDQLISEICGVAATALKS